jgi:hypothetical protein
MRSIRSSVSTLIGFAGLSGTSRPRTSSSWRSSKGSSGKETRPSGHRQARVRWAPSDGPASDRRPLAQMAPAPSEPRATTFSSRDPLVHRPFGLFVAAAGLLVPAQVARPRAPDPRAARTDRGSRGSVEAGAVTLRPCLHCGRHYHSDTGVRGAAVTAAELTTVSSHARSERGEQGTRHAGRRREHLPSSETAAGASLWSDREPAGSPHRAARRRRRCIRSREHANALRRLSWRATPGGSGLDGSRGVHTRR